MDFKCSNASLVADNERGNLTSVATLLWIASFCLENHRSRRSALAQRYRRFLTFRACIVIDRLRFSFHQYAVCRISNPNTHGNANRKSDSYPKPDADRS